RPVRIEFCEADVLDAFDQWRRAVGPQARRASEADDPAGSPTQVAAGQDPSAAGRTRRGPSLAAHLDRVVERLSSIRAGTTLAPSAGEAVDTALRDLDALAGRARGARGDMRQGIREELVRIDEQLLEAMLSSEDDATRERLARHAAEELRPLRDRLPPDAYAQACRRLARQLLRQERGLPEVVLP
ncbi:MAG: hypothetical protein ACLGHP_05280, partial [Vicinamibacteria bacterium]